MSDAPCDADTPEPAAVTKTAAAAAAPCTSSPATSPVERAPLRSPAWSAIAAFGLLLGALLVARGLHAWSEHADARAVAVSLARVVSIQPAATDSWPAPADVRAACEEAAAHADSYARTTSADPDLVARMRARASALNAAPAMYDVLYPRRGDPETHEAFANAPFTRLTEVAAACALAGRQESWGYLAMGWATLLVPLYVWLRRRRCATALALSLTCNVAAAAVIGQALLYIVG